MPYIKPDRRDTLDLPLKYLVRRLASEKNDPGDYHYCMAVLLNAYLWRNGPDHAPNYALRQDAYGMAAGLAAEFYRRNLANYEDLKIAMNGDVYGFKSPALPDPDRPITVSHDGDVRPRQG